MLKNIPRNRLKGVEGNRKGFQAFMYDRMDIEHITGKEAIELVKQDGIE